MTGFFPSALKVERLERLMRCDMFRVSLRLLLKAVISVSPRCVLSDMQKRLIHEEALHNNILISLPESPSHLAEVEN